MSAWRNVSVVGVVLAAAGGAFAQTYWVRPLGSLGGFGDTRALALGSASGAQTPVVAGFATHSTQNYRAFSWGGAAGPTMAGLPPLTPDTQSVGFAVDGGGRVVAVSYTLGKLASSAVRWSGGVPIVLGGFEPHGANASGDVCGTVSVLGGDEIRAPHACFYKNATGQLTDLGTLGGSRSSGALAHNNVGMIVGWSSTPDGFGTRPAMWFAGSVRDLGTLGGNQAQVYSVNTGTAAVGYSTLAGTPAARRATRWSLNPSTGQVLSVTDLGVLPAAIPGGGTWSYAYGVNDAGMVVGTSSGRAFVVSRGSMRDLTALTPPMEGWFIVAAHAVNDAGQIAAWGADAAGTPRALLLTSCDADVDRSGTLSSQDVFGFLTLYFAADPRADFNGDGQRSPTDIFAFLTAYFVGCAAAG